MRRVGVVLFHLLGLCGFIHLMEALVIYLYGFLFIGGLALRFRAGIFALLLPGIDVAALDSGARLALYGAIALLYLIGLIWAISVGRRVLHWLGDTDKAKVD